MKGFVECGVSHSRKQPIGDEFGETFQSQTADGDLSDLTLDSVEWVGLRRVGLKFLDRNFIYKFLFCFLKVHLGYSPTQPCVGSAFELHPAIILLP